MSETLSSVATAQVLRLTSEQAAALVAWVLAEDRQFAYWAQWARDLAFSIRYGGHSFINVNVMISEPDYLRDIYRDMCRHFQWKCQLDDAEVLAG